MKLLLFLFTLISCGKVEINDVADFHPQASDKYNTDKNKENELKETSNEDSDKELDEVINKSSSKIKEHYFCYAADILDHEAINSSNYVNQIDADFDIYKLSSGDYFLQAKTYENFDSTKVNEYLFNSKIVQGAKSISIAQDGIDVLSYFDNDKNNKTNWSFIFDTESKSAIIILSDKDFDEQIKIKMSCRKIYNNR